MEKFCQFCGEVMTDGTCPSGEHTFKKMCVNCEFCKETNDGLGLICSNTKNMETAKEKILQIAKESSGGYRIDDMTLTLSPLPLKNPTKKCGEWALSEETLEALKNLFV